MKRAARIGLMGVLALGALGLSCRQSPRAYAPPATLREVQALGGDWRFLATDHLEGAAAIAFDDRAWQVVRLPHTWAISDSRTYRRAWYRTRFARPWNAQRQRIFLAFDGVGAIADVYLNGRHIGQHRGAYTRSVFDVTESLAAGGGENVLALRVSNDPQETADCLPSGTEKQLYHVYGGIYRQAWLLRTDPVHIDPTDHGSPGVTFRTPKVDAHRAEYSTAVRVRNTEGGPHDVSARVYLVDGEGRERGALATQQRVEAGAVATLSLAGALDDPRLWGPGRPDLYDLHVEVWSDGRLVDRVSQKVGFRDFRMRDGRFILNGEPILIRGVGKHQETETAAAAVSDGDLEEDFANLADLGVNMVRLAHYPHAPLAYDLADRHGILVWAENGNSNPGLASATGETITREMVRQHGNHPSVVIWGIGNETDYRGVARYSAVVRAEDPQRLITYASSTGVRPKAQRQLDFIAQNKYLGWYADEPAWDIEKVAPEVRYVSETGGGSVITQHCDYHRERAVVDVFEPEEYRQMLAEAQFQTVFRAHRDDVPLFLVWVFRDFGMPSGRKYKGVNTKGFLTRDNFRKDSYYLYRAFLRPEQPTLHIASQTYFLRRGARADQLKAYSNQPQLTLTVDDGPPDVMARGRYRQGNGRSVDNVFHWRKVFHPGRNRVRVVDDTGRVAEATFYFIPDGASAWPEDPRALVQGLRSSNGRNPAYFIDAPVQDQWPFYYEFDGAADNTFVTIPPSVRGASWIATRRLSRPENRTDIEFHIASESRGANVWILAAARARQNEAWRRAGFRDTGEACEWRDTALKRVPCSLLHRAVEAGEPVHLPGHTLDYVVLVREQGAATGALKR